MLTAFARKADEGTIGKLIVEAVILLSARSQSDGGKVLRAAAQAYGVDTDAVALKVKQEFAAKEKARKAKASAEVGGENLASGVTIRQSLDLSSGRSIFSRALVFHPKSCSRIARERHVLPTPDGRTLSEPTAPDIQKSAPLAGARTS